MADVDDTMDVPDSPSRVDIDVNDTAQSTSKPKDRVRSTGSTKFPLQRVRKIARFDADIQMLSTAASLIICGAAERFAGYYAEQAYRFAQAEGKKSLQYKHCAKAVARVPQLEFLADVVPSTSTYGEVKRRRQEADAAVAEMAGDDRVRLVEDEAELVGRPVNKAKPGSGIKLKFKTGKVPAWAKPKDAAAPERSTDVEMADA